MSHAGLDDNVHNSLLPCYVVNTKRVVPISILSIPTLYTIHTCFTFFIHKHSFFKAFILSYRIEVNVFVSRFVETSLFQINVCYTIHKQQAFFNSYIRLIDGKLCMLFLSNVN